MLAYVLFQWNGKELQTAMRTHKYCSQNWMRILGQYIQ